MIADSFGRAWRQGQCEVAIGCAGLTPARDWRGEPDSDGREMHASVIAIADEAAAAADLARGKTSREPAVRVRGLDRFVLPDDGPEPPRSSGPGPTTSSASERQRRLGGEASGATRPTDSHRGDDKSG